MIASGLSDLHKFNTTSDIVLFYSVYACYEKEMQHAGRGEVLL